MNPNEKPSDLAAKAMAEKGSAAKTPAIKTPPPPPAPVTTPTSGKVPPLFRRIDWWAMVIAFLGVWIVYFNTLAPQVTLEDSGELTTASYWAGIPHPPGYPFWTIYTWLWTVLVPFKNIAWRVQFAESSTAALACGILALMVSRGSSMLMEGIEELKGMTGKWENAICLVCGVVGGMMLGFGSSMWKESVVINRISLFGVPWLMLVLVFMMRWMYAPHQRRYLYAAMFCFGICWTIHQTLMLAAIGIEVGIAMCSPKLGRDVFLGNCVIFFGVLAAKSAHVFTGFDSANPMILRIFMAGGIASIIICAYLTIQTGGLLTEWASILLMGLVFSVGISFYFYEAIAGMTNPPMEWGYPRTVEGFWHAITRGQYDKVAPTDIFKDPHHFYLELRMLVTGLADAFSWVYMFFAVLPLAFILKMQKRERAWIILVAGIYPFLGVLLSITLSPTQDRQMSDLVKVFFIASHALIAILIGYGLALTTAFMATHYQRFRRWGIMGGLVAVLLALFNMKDVTAKNFFGLEGDLTWGELPHWIGQAFAPDQYGLPIFASLILVLTTILFVAALLAYRDRAPLLITLALFCTAPLYAGMSHWFHSEQRDHWYGYYFGHDMFTPPVKGPDGKLTYDAKVREAALKGPNAKLVYPEMARDSVVYGGTDPGRFCPTYMIFCESFIPHSCQEMDTNFDRRDCYLITQNALADNTYLDYIRAQYNRSAQTDPPFFQNFLSGSAPAMFHGPSRWLAWLDDIFETIGAKVEYRRRTGTSFFAPGQFTNVKDLASKLRKSDRQDALSKYLYGKLSADTQKLVDSQSDESSLARALSTDFNIILTNGTIYTSERFKDIQLPQLIVEAQSAPNIPATWVRLNRRMLEEAYPGDIVKSLGGVYPDTEIQTATPDDSQNCFNDYLADAQRRLQHDNDFPNEPRQIKPGEDVHVENNRVSVSGQVAVMAINGLLTKVIFDRNPHHDFYVEESFPLDWMYPYLTPFGVIMKINRQPVAELSRDVIDRDHAFWSDFSTRTIGNWITYDTSIKQICDWADKTYLRHNFAGFTGDRSFIRDDDGQKAFSKLRSSIGASIYQWRMRNSHSQEESARMTKEAEFALKQAFALCPYSPEAVFHLMDLLLNAGRIDDALAILNTCQKLDPYNDQILDWIQRLQGAKSSAAAPGNNNNNQVSQVLDQIEHAIASKQTATAMQMLDQVLEAPGLDPNSMMRIANIYLQSGNFPKSEEAIKKLAQMVPNSSEPWYNLAVIQSHEGKTADAIASLKKVWELNPEEIKQNKQMIDLRAHFYQDPNFAQLRATPEFKAAFPAKP
jgi:tetratricopeptide (TPR) repeat protein